MKILNIETVHNSCVQNEHVVSFNVSEEEAHELMKCVAIIEIYKAAALSALNREETDSEWRSFDFKRRDNIIHVIHKSGMIG